MMRRVGLLSSVRRRTNKSLEEFFEASTVKTKPGEKPPAHGTLRCPRPRPLPHSCERC